MRYWLGVLLLALAAESAFAETVAPDQRGHEANDLVAEAAHRSWYALNDESQKLLERALEIAPDHALARWRSGFVRLGKRWVQAEKAPEVFGRHAVLDKYETLRSRTPDTVAGHMQLANWAASKQLGWMEVAHLRHVTHLNPDHQEARRRLGEVKINDDWVPVGALWNRDRAIALNRAIKEWTPEIRRLVRARSDAVRDEFRRKLTDAEAIPAIEVLLGGGDERAARMGAAILTDIAHPRATTALARLAVLSPFPSVRQASAQALRSRSKYEYVPLLLGELSSPIQSRVDGFVRNGRSFMRHSMVREEEGQYHVEVRDYSLEIRNPSAPRMVDMGRGTDGWRTEVRLVPSEGLLTQALREMLRDRTLQFENLRMAQNAWIGLMNRRIAEALATSTGEAYNSPDEWWDWWNRENEVTVVSKRTSLNYDSQRFSYNDITPITPVVSRSHECFIAGTPVQTHRGAKPIEQIRVGDLVLSQHPHTGELAYRPVVTTSRRPPEALVRVYAAGGVLEGTGGHPVWVVGDGWVKLRDVRSGMLLHGLGGAVPVSHSELGGFATTYNLVVEGSPSYFAGPFQVLAHDNTSRGPSPTILPGGEARR